MAEPSDSSGRRTVVASRRDSWQARSEAEDPIQERQERLTKKYLVGSRLNRTKSNASDALSGDPTRAAIASCAAGMVQASLLLPMNTVQTQMQFRGVSLPATLQLLFARGPLSGMANLYRAIMPTVGMLGARQGLKFGSGAAFKRRLPLHWLSLIVYRYHLQVAHKPTLRWPGALVAAEPVRPLIRRDPVPVYT